MDTVVNPNDLIVSQTDSRPMYLQIVDQIKQRVAVGDWARGAEIPSIRQLAVVLRISVITVKRAYLDLEREGVIVTHQGRPSTVAPNPALGARIYDEELARLIDQVARLATLLGLTAVDLAGRIQGAMSGSSRASVVPNSGEST